MELEKINKVMMANQGYIDNVSARDSEAVALLWNTIIPKC